MIALIEPASTDRIAVLQRTISASRLGLWLTCRLKFHFRYVLKIPKPTTPALHTGTTIHAVLQAWNLARWRKEPFEPATCKELFEARWLDQATPIDWDGEEEQQRQQAWRMLEMFFAETPIQADEKPEAVEVSVETDLSRHGLPTFIGVIDLVRAGGRIVDFKTSGKTPGCRPSETSARNPVVLLLGVVSRCHGPEGGGHRAASPGKDQGAQARGYPAGPDDLEPANPVVPLDRIVREGVGTGRLRALTRVSLCRVRVFPELPVMEGRLTMYENRLTVVGRTRAFQNGDWLAAFSGRYADPLEFGATRFACQFETIDSPLPALQRLSRSHPRLIFLLDYETRRIKGLAKAKAGRLIHHQIRY